MEAQCVGGWALLFPPNKRNIDESEPKFQPAPHVRATDTEIRLDSPAKRGVYDNFRFLSSNGLGGKTKKKLSGRLGM